MAEFTEAEVLHNRIIRALDYLDQLHGTAAPNVAVRADMVRADLSDILAPQGRDRILNTRG